MVATSLGTGSNEYGIAIDSSSNVNGAVHVGNGGTILLVGSGGGLYTNSSGASNVGLYLNGAT